MSLRPWLEMQHPHTLKRSAPTYSVVPFVRVGELRAEVDVEAHPHVLPEASLNLPTPPWTPYHHAPYPPLPPLDPTAMLPEPPYPPLDPLPPCSRSRW